MLLFLDIETTGLQPEEAEIIELSAVRFDGKEIVAQFDELIALPPEHEIPLLIQRITGITPDMLQGQKNIGEVRQMFLEDFLREDDIIVGHNISFDTGFLRANGFEFENVEIDTYPLSTIILPAEESHSLEVLTDKYGLSHENAHRALGDVLANLDLWQFLQMIFAKDFSSEVQNTFRTILEKSAWTGKRFFTDVWANGVPESFIYRMSGPADEIVYLKENSEKTDQEKEFQNALFTYLADKKSGLWELRPAFEIDPFALASEAAAAFAQDQQKSVGIAFHAYNQETVEILQRQLAQKFPDLSFAFFAPPELFLSQEKWEIFLRKESFAADETAVALKVLRELDQGSQCAPSLKHGEWDVWEALSDRNNPESLPEKLLEKHDILFLPHKLLALFPGKYLISDTAEHLDILLTNYAERKSDSRRLRTLAENVPEKWRQQINFFFDLLGGFLRKKAGENIFPVDILVDASLEQQKDWQDFGLSLQDIIADIQKESNGNQELLAALHVWKAFFVNTTEQENTVRFFKLFPSDDVQCIADPIALEPALESLLQEKESVLLFGSNFPKKPDGTWQFLLELPAKLEQKHIDFADGESLPFQICAASEVQQSDNTPKTIVKWLCTMLQNSSGNILANFSSKRTIEEVEDLLTDFAAAHDITVISHQKGGKGKIHNFLRRDGQTLFLGTQAFFEKILPLPGLTFDIYFFQKFLFDPPSQILLSERNKLFANNFTDVALPRSMARFEKEVFRLMASQKEPYVFLCFDSRLVDKKGFGRYFKSVLPKNIEVKSIAFDQLSDVLS